MRRLALPVAVAVAATLALAPIGVAGSGSVSDPRGDLWATPSSGGSDRLDLVRATFGHTSKGRLVHTATLAGAASSPSGSGGIPTLYIVDPELPNGQADCRYFVGRHDGRLGVFTCAYADRVASARITRTSSNTIRYEFSPAAIDSPASYDWAFVTTGIAHGAEADLDRLPSGDRSYVTHRLR